MAPSGRKPKRKWNAALHNSSIRRSDDSKRPKESSSQCLAVAKKELTLKPTPAPAMEESQCFASDFAGFPATIDTAQAMMTKLPLLSSSSQQHHQHPGMHSSSSSSSSSMGMNAEQIQRWRHAFAGTACSSLQFPVSKYRLLGVITKSFSFSLNIKSSNTKKSSNNNNNMNYYYPIQPARRAHITEAAARRELLPSFLLSPETASPQLQRQAVLELKNAWDSELLSSPVLQGQRAPWDEHGNLRADRLTLPPCYVPVTDLYQQLGTVQQQQKLQQQQSTMKYYNDPNLEQMQQILLSCQDLQDPSHLWKIPLLLTIPIVKHNNNTTTTIQMGIYGHRLLPLTTTKTLGVVLNALDRDSYRVTAPLWQLPQPAQPTFATSPFPVVTFPTDDNEDHHDNDEDSTSDGPIPRTAAAVEKENQRNSKTGPPPCDEDQDCEYDANNALADDDDDCKKKPAAVKRNYDDWMEDRNGDQNSIIDRDDQTVSAFTTKGLLKLLENTGVDMTGYDTNIVPRLESSLQLELLPHQQHAIQWMVQMEQVGNNNNNNNNNAKFGINSLLWEEREFWDGGHYYYCPALGQMRLEPPHHGTGGLLCDEMGLGKTIEVLGLILATLPELKGRAQETGESYATLIVVPPALVGQWQNEIVKTTGQGTLIVEYVDFHPNTTVPHWTTTTTTTTTSRHPDIVLTTYKALQVPKIARQLHETCWGRVVLDEMQEIRSSTTKIAQTCEKLQCNRRWMLSGTPLFEGIEDLRGELNFLRLEPFGANCEDGFFDFMIQQPWEARDVHAIEILKILSTVMLRRSKSMTVCASGAQILGLPPLTVEYVPVPQTESERALYCYLEAVVSEEARAKDQTGKSKSSSRLLCLRLLREMCTSAVLLNGGLGVASQLKELNNLLIKQARRAANSSETNRAEPYREYQHGTIVMSCDEAIMHLAQLQEATRTGADYVAGLALGFGQGLSRRVRASDSMELKLAEAEERMHSAIAQYQAAKSQRAKIRWHVALEKVTMGRLPHQCVLRAERKFRILWRLRSLASTLCAQSPGQVLPLVLRRGWRPDSRMTQCWHWIRPAFFWSHPVSFILEGIPCQVSEKELGHSLAEGLEDMAVGDSYSLAAALSNFDVFKIGATPASDTWRAGLVFSSYEVAAAFLKATRKSTGIHLAHQEIVPAIQSRILQTKAAYREARAMVSVHPTSNAAAKRRIAKEAYKSALLGLRIVSTSVARRTAGDIVIKRAQDDFRNADVNSCQSFFVSTSVLLDELCQTLLATNTLISTEQRRIGRYRQAAGKEGPVAGVSALSAFDSLQALSNGASESTSCCICLDILGSNDGGDDDDARNTACISMTKCGHLYCRGCLTECLDAATMNYARPQCPACRKQIDLAQDVFFIDPTKQDKTAASARENAKATVLTLSQALEQSSGCLSPQLWYDLFLSIDYPIRGDNALDHRVSALPRHFMAHLREALDGLPVHSKVKASPRIIDIGKNYISSKVKYLLHNLPENERSVVFSSSKATVQHLLFVLRSIGIECRTLFSGQKVDDSERAVAEWKSTEYQETGEVLIPVPVLLVQSGAAASGLTLTASSQLFLLEPFLHQSEEQQAFGRSHRYGQEHPVQAKVLYTPVSVESRLLEWRRRGVSTTIDAKIVYMEEEVDSDEEDEKSNAETESDQTRFLLGLHAGSLSATTEMNVD